MTFSDFLALLAHYARLTDRDRAILAILDEHRVLTTDQITRLFFNAERTCRNRLHQLHRIGLLDRFRYARTGGGAHPWNWVLGLHGSWYMAGTTGRPLAHERSHRDRVLRLSAHPILTHQIMANEFGVRLAHTARRQPGIRIDRWWSERTATTRFLRVRPDAHGLYSIDNRTVGWFLECDMGTESLPKLISKLDTYHQLALADGPTYPVLFWLPGRTREANLQRRLHQHPPPVPVATAVHDDDPAGTVWLPAGARARTRLITLPSAHGRNSAANPNYRDGTLDLTGPPGPDRT
jgi:hypothetical protein